MHSTRFDQQVLISLNQQEILLLLRSLQTLFLDPDLRDIHKIADAQQGFIKTLIEQLSQTLHAEQGAVLNTTQKNSLERTSSG